MMFNVLNVDYLVFFVTVALIIPIYALAKNLIRGEWFIALFNIGVIVVIVYLFTNIVVKLDGLNLLVRS